MANIFLKKDNNFELARQELIKKVQDEDIKFFLQYHYLRVENIYDFLHSNEKIMALCGFRASGKNITIQSALYFLPENVCKIILDCPQSICADDIMLFVYNRLKNYCIQKQISLKKPSSPDFMQTVSECLSQIKEPIVFVFNSFENCLKENNENECVRFLEFLNKFENIKVIISARQIDNKNNLNNLNIQKYTTKALEYDSMLKFFEINGFNLQKDAAEALYEHSGGYWGYSEILINILKAFSLSLEDFLTEFENKNTSFDKFLIEKLLSLVSDNVRNVLEFLASLRINFPISAILSLNFATQEEIDYLIKKQLLCVFEEYVYVKDYIKEAVLKDTKTYTKYKINKFLSEFFENQLPLKPKDRMVELSRHTMREEIKYHNIFVKANSASDKPSQARLPKSVVNMSYLSYSRGLKNKNTSDMTKIMENVKFDNKKPTIEGSDGTVFELESDELVNTLNSLDKKLIKDANKIVSKDENVYIEEKEKTPVPIQNENIKDIVKYAQNYDEKKDFAKANEFYDKAIQKTENEKERYEIYLKMGRNYKKMNDYSNAVEYFEKALEIGEINNFKQENLVILTDLADIYKDSFKTVKAKNLYYELLSENDLDSLILIRCYLGLAEIDNSEHNNQTTKAYFGKIFSLIDKIQDNNIISEVYFKFGLFNDDENNINEALKWYEKSIEISNEESPFISSCYSNIASIYEEKNLPERALKNYQQALLIDRKNNNFEGLYYCNSKLAKLIENKDKNSAKNYFITAIKYAKLINDDFYIASAYLKFGDFCYKIGENKTALKNYLIAKNHVQKDVYDDNLGIIESRLKDLKIRMGKDKYLDAIKELKNNGK